MTINGDLRGISKYGDEARFAANVIHTRCANRARKLRTLHALLAAGFAVRCAAYSTDALVGIGTGAACGFDVLDADPAHAVEAAWAARFADRQG